ncbi:MAG: GTPase ObgE, partial [Mycoplasmataceae bacterium]|nr:GTPase ObgE [Mycoplasmataceae bacterium]
MKFIDQVNIEIIAGKGGDGIISFRHEHRVEKGGPFGGDGGDGGDVYFQGDSGMNTLLPIYVLKHIRGNDGQNGMTKNMYGARGKDIVVKVPFGTLVYEGNKLICDVIDDQKYLICKG